MKDDDSIIGEEDKLNGAVLVAAPKSSSKYENTATIAMFRNQAWELAHYILKQLEENDSDTKSSVFIPFRYGLKC